MVVGVRGGCSGSGGVWRAGLSLSGGSTLIGAWFWAGVAGPGGAGWSLGREAGGPGVSQVAVAVGSCGRRSSRAHWWCLAGTWTERGGL